MTRVTRVTRETRGTACCGEGGALADACIKTDAPRSTVAVGYPLATNQRYKSKAKFFRQKGLDTTLGEFLGDGLYYGVLLIAKTIR